MSRKIKIIAGLGAAVVVVGALTAFIRSRDKDLPRVTTAKVEKVDLVAKVTANGKIQAKNKVDMSALVMGQIVNLAVREGDHVKKGQLLLQIASVGRRRRLSKGRRVVGHTSLIVLVKTNIGGRDSPYPPVERWGALYVHFVTHQSAKSVVCGACRRPRLRHSLRIRPLKPTIPTRKTGVSGCLACSTERPAITTG